MRDTRLKGLLLRVQPSGVMTWYVEYGRGKRIGLGRVDAIKSTKARDEAKKILSDVYAGKDPMAARRAERTHTLRSYLDDVYGPWAENNIRTHKKTLQRLGRHFPELIGKKLKDINPWLVEKWRMRRLKEGAKPSTVNRDLDDLKSCLHKAVLWGHIETHPIQSVKRSRVDSMPVVRFLSDEERVRLFQALSARENRICAERARANQWRAARNYDRLP
ncbi:MAG: integrase family protein, partial [Rhodospirillaceae bacterium]|nr:integrase family protein [Rhodospirillaceae bacterium]